MKFSDLLTLPYNENTGVIGLDAIAAYLPESPEVVREVYSDHGRKSELQAEYGLLPISRIKWECIALDASEIVQCSIRPDPMQWVGTVAKRVNDFPAKSWRCIDERQSVVTYWASHHTWLVPPVLLKESVLSDGSGLHLMEGHTRIGTLKGLVSHGILAGSSQHRIWIGAF